MFKTMAKKNPFIMKVVSSTSLSKPEKSKNAKNYCDFGHYEGLS
jgi:hypothetical protein